MNQNQLIFLFVIGCIVSIIGFALAQYLPTLIIIAFIIFAYLYSDFMAWRDSTKTNLKKIEERVDALEKKI